MERLIVSGLAVFIVRLLWPQCSCGQYLKLTKDYTVSPGKTTHSSTQVQLSSATVIIRLASSLRFICCYGCIAQEGGMLRQCLDRLKASGHGCENHSSGRRLA